MVAGIATVLVFACALGDTSGHITGTIEGVVVNASHGNLPVAEAEVILEVQLEGEFAPVEKTQTDATGHFQFDNLPVGPEALYLPGATRDEIFYPGRRIQLSPANRTANLTVAVCDSVRNPNPLVIRQHEVVLRAEPGVLQVVEAMLIDNPGKTTYIGSGVPDAKMVSTFDLGIPSDFSRLTFEKEFYGRQFHLVDGRVLTTIPWTPGQRSLRFTYTIPNEDAHRVWEHRLDVPCQHLLIRVQHEHPDEITSSLGPAVDVTTGEARFEFTAQQLAGRNVVQISLGQLPRTWTYYARWGALAMLVSLATGVVLWRWAGRRRRHRDSAGAPMSKPAIPQVETQRDRARKPSRKRRRRAA